jgi:high affinity Mn2+ porin
MLTIKKLAAVSFALGGILLLGSGNAHALHPELSVPEKVDAKHKACQELMRISAKYGIDGLFTKDFQAGESTHTRTDLAVAVFILTEKLAQKAANEGAALIAKEDLLFLSELQEELRGEMLLARSRAFQMRYSDLGTNLNAVTKDINLSGGFVGVLQGSVGNEPRDQADVVGRADLVFSFKVGENTIAVVDVEATGGDGIDVPVSNFSTLNGVAGSTGDTVRFREAWIEHSAFSDRLIMTAGKIDLTNYFDANAVANDENAQFLAGAFVNSAVLGAADIGPGVRATAKLAEAVTFGIGYGSGDADSADSLEHGFGIAELGYTLKLGEREGNYRVYGTLDGALPDGDSKLVQKTAVGFGVSLDQQITGNITVFARYGERDKDVYLTKRAWSAGGQYAGLFPGRNDDVLGLAYGQIQAVGADSQEKLAELYYKAKLNDQIELAPVVQYLVDPNGDSSRDNVLALGLRAQISF